MGFFVQYWVCLYLFQKIFAVDSKKAGLKRNIYRDIKFKPVG